MCVCVCLCVCVCVCSVRVCMLGAYLPLCVSSVCVRACVREHHQSVFLPSGIRMFFFCGSVKKALRAPGQNDCLAEEILINLRHKLPTPSTVNRDYGVAVGGVKQLRSMVPPPCVHWSCPEYGNRTGWDDLIGNQGALLMLRLTHPPLNRNKALLFSSAGRALRQHCHSKGLITLSATLY